MKKIHILQLSILLAAGSAQAATYTIIDATTRNGSFELNAAGNAQPTGGSTGSTLNDSQFWTTPGNAAIGTVTAGTDLSVNDNWSSVGDWAASLGDRTNFSQYYTVSQNTAYTVQSGDVFTLSFDYGTPNGAWTVDDELEYYVYTSANSGSPILSGTVSGFTSTTAGDGSALSTGNIVSTAITGTDVGETLMIEFNYKVGSIQRFVRVDNVSLTVGDEPPPPEPVKPNVLIVLADDMNWRDCGPYVGMSGGIDSLPATVTPNIETLASQGLTFNFAFSPASMCSPCRHALYTGIHPVRSGAHGNHTQVKTGTKSIAHHLQSLGYKVDLVGKSHINPASSFPWDVVDVNGADPFCLIFASDYPHHEWTDGTPPHTTQAEIDAITFPPDMVNTATTREMYNRYLGEIEELDDQVGSYMSQIAAAGKTDNTIFIFLSEQGSSFPGAKWTCYELGNRAACVIRWPDVVTAGTRTDAMIDYVDILPTLIEAAGGTLPQGLDRLDGRSFLEVLAEGKPSHRDYVYYQHTAEHTGAPAGGYAIRAIRGARYKLIWNLQHASAFANIVTDDTQNRQGHQVWDSWVAAAVSDTDAAFLVNRYQNRPEYEFYDLETDPYELNNLVGTPEHAARIAEMKALLEQWMAYQTELWVDDAGDPRYGAGSSVKSQGIWTEQNRSVNWGIPQIEAYELWADIHGLTGADRNKTADTDGDGIPQEGEWMGGGDPNRPDTYGVQFGEPSAENLSNGFVDIAFNRLVQYENYQIDYTIESTDDLSDSGSWAEESGSILQWPVPQGDGLVEQVTIRIPADAQEMRRFYRLRSSTD